MATLRIFHCLLVSAPLLLIAIMANTGNAGSLPAPHGKVILTISGNIKMKNTNGTAQFDRAMLEELGMTVLETSTPWYTGPVKFEGVLLRKLMEHVGSNGQTVVATALNDYTTEIPISDLYNFQVVLALKRNGVYMPVRDKGPLFIVYPFDSKPELKSQIYYGRSAWQVTKLVVR